MAQSWTALACDWTTLRAPRQRGVRRSSGGSRLCSWKLLFGMLLLCQLFWLKSHHDVAMEPSSTGLRGANERKDASFGSSLHALSADRVKGHVSLPSTRQSKVFVLPVAQPGDDHLANISQPEDSDALALALVEHLTNEVADPPPCHTVTMVWTRSAAEFTQRHMLAVESVFRRNPCAHVSVHATDLPSNMFSHIDDAGLSVTVVPIDMGTLSRRSVGGVWAGQVEKHERGSAFHDHLAQFVAVDELYRHGGFYVDMNYLLAQPLDLMEMPNAIAVSECESLTASAQCFTYETAMAHRIATWGGTWAVDGVHRLDLSVLWNFEQGHPLLRHVLASFDAFYDVECGLCRAPAFAGGKNGFGEYGLAIMHPQVTRPQSGDVVASVIEGGGNDASDSAIEMALTLRVQDIPQGMLQAALRETSPFDHPAEAYSSTAEAAQRVSPMRVDTANILVGDVFPWHTEADWSFSSGCAADGVGKAGGAGYGDDGSMDVSASVLSYMRLDELLDVLASIAAFPPITNAYVVNNDPSVWLSPDTLEEQIVGQRLHKAAANQRWRGESAHWRKRFCVAVYNTNTGDRDTALFLARFLACVRSMAKVCYFQDDDWIVQSKDALLESFMRAPGRVHTVTNADMVRLEHLWRFYDREAGLHTKFSWLGTGAMMSRKVVNSFLCRLRHMVPRQGNRQMADFFLTPLQNTVPNVIEGSIAELTRRAAFSGEEGTKSHEAGVRRNMVYMHYAVELAHRSVALANARDSDTTSVPLTCRVPLLGDAYSVGGVPTPSQGLGAPTFVSASASAAWAACHGADGVLATNAHPFPEFPTRDRKLDDGVFLQQFVTELMESDMEAGWQYIDYPSHPIGHAADKSDDTFFLAQMTGAGDLQLNLVSHKFIDAKHTLVSVVVCAEDGPASLSYIGVDDDVAQVGLEWDDSETHAGEDGACTSVRLDVDMSDALGATKASFGELEIKLGLKSDGLVVSGERPDAATQRGPGGGARRVRIAEVRSRDCA